MLKRLCLAFAGLFALVSSAMAAGTIGGISMTQQLDQYGKPLSGGLLYLIQAGTTSTPQNCYKDTALTLPWPNPVVLDAFGRTPQLFCADGQIKIRLTDKFGGPVLTQDNILVIGPSSGGGGGGSIDPTTIAATGDLKVAYGTQTITGWVRMNGRTIGSATSGATERANADTQALFQYLWTTDTTLAVSGGRGASSIADWTANKAITLPDGRGRTMAGLDDMGNSPAGRLTATYFGATGGCASALGTTLGAACGGESQTLTLAQIPTGINANGSNVISVKPQNGFSGIPTTPTAGNVTGSNSVTGAGTVTVSSTAASWAGVSTLSDTNSISVTSNNTGGAAHPQVQPTMLITYYLKL